MSHSNMPRVKGRSAELEAGGPEEGPESNYSILEGKQEFSLTLSQLSEKGGPAGSLTLPAFAQKPGHKWTSRILIQRPFLGQALGLRRGPPFCTPPLNKEVTEVPSSPAHMPDDLFVPPC